MLIGRCKSGPTKSYRRIREHLYKGPTEIEIQCFFGTIFGEACPVCWKPVGQHDCPECWEYSEDRIREALTEAFQEDFTEMPFVNEGRIVG